jgi:Zn-dependent protease with chaperone function
MKLYRALIYWLLLVGICLNAQTNPPTLLQSSGPLPEFLTQTPSEKFSQRLREKKLTSSQGTEAEDQTAFYLQTTYLFDEILRSGYVLYNDPVGKYLNEVLDVILAASPDLKTRNPKVYVLNSTEVNAFAIDQGIIFVSLGLLSQLENEAQLALILAHELAHVVESHALDGFLTAAKIDRENLKNTDTDTQEFDLATLMKNNYSREQEIDADEIGTTYFLRTGYNRKTIVRVFNILRYAHLPYDEIAFGKDVLEKGSLVLPEKVLLEEIKLISPPEEVDETESSHPALSKRIDLLRTTLLAEGDVENDDRPNYLVSEERFMLARQLARTELPHLYLQDQYLSEAIYSAFLLEQTYGTNAYSQEMIGKALYGWAKFKSNDQTLDVNSPRWPQIEGESQQLFHIINKLNSEELTILAIAYNYDLLRQQPENTALRKLLVDLFGELYIEHDIKSLTHFVKIAPPLPTPDQEAKQEDGDEENLTKLDKITRSQQEQNINPDWDKAAFSDYLSDTTFLALAEDGFDYGQERKSLSDYYDSSTAEGRRNQAAYERRKRSGRASLGIDHITLLNPTYLHISNKRKSKELNYQQSEVQQQVLKEVFVELAEDADIQLNVLDPHQLATTDAQVLNDYALANNWISTQLDTENFVYHGYDKARMDDFAERYQTQFLMTSIVISTPKTGLFGRLFSPGESLLFVVIFDLETGKRSFLKSEYLKSYMSKLFLKSQLYDALLQLKKSR